jgi:hypothetical protein
MKQFIVKLDRNPYKERFFDEVIVADNHEDAMKLAEKLFSSDTDKVKALYAATYQG